MTRAGVWVGIGTVVYLLALGHVSVGDIAVAGGLAAAALSLFRRIVLGGVRIPPARRRSWLLLPLFAHVVADIVRGTFDVARVILRPRRGIEPGFVTVGMGERSRRGVLFTALIATLSPGSVLVDLDWHTRTMRFHLLDTRDAERFRRGLEAFYTRYQRWLVP